MTYLHALQYLAGPDTAHTGGANDVGDVAAAFRTAIDTRESRFLYLSFADDRTGWLTAALCRAALIRSGVCVGEIADTAAGPLADVLRIDGAPVPPPVLRELCHTARATEQKLLREDARRRAARAAEEDGVPPSPRTLSYADRCAAVLPRLFSDAGCRVLLLIGETTDPRLRPLSHRAPASGIAVLSAGEYKPLHVFPTGIGEAVCPTCSRTVFQRVTDACSHAKSRLTMTATTHLRISNASPFSRHFSYRELTDCRLCNGSDVFLRAAMLAYEALLALKKLGCNVPAEAMRQGFSQTDLALFCQPLSIRPLLIAHAIRDRDDTRALLSWIQEFRAVLPQQLHLLKDASLPHAECDRLSGFDAVTELQTEQSLCHLLSSDAGQSNDSTAFLLVGTPERLQPMIAAWQSQLRSL